MSRCWASSAAFRSWRGKNGWRFCLRHPTTRPVDSGINCVIPFAGVWIVMAKSKKKAETVFLVCDETGDLNYAIRRKPGGEKLKLKKYSPRLRKHTLHSEKKK